MAGFGRRSHYRKHLTDAVLHDLPEPEQGECIAKVVATRGGNQFDVLVAGVDMNTRTPQLAILPTKFHKLIWVKRGDFCIVRTGDTSASASAKQDERTGTGGGVRYLITHVLYKDQVKHLKSLKLWPDDEQFATLENTEAKDKESKWTSGEEDDEDGHEVVDDGIVYDNEFDDELFVNTNRVAALQIQDSESESSDDE